MAEFRLHCMKESGNAYKAALMLELCGCDWQPVWVDYFNGATRGDSFRGKLNEMGEVPVLEHKGKRLTQSGVILDYLAESLGQFGPADTGERREILRWILWDNHKLTSYTATLRWLRTFTKDPDPAVMTFLRGRAQTAWGVLDTHLAGRRSVVGERLTIADLSLAGYLFFADEIGVDWATYPNIRGWLDRIRSEPRWAHPYELMPGHPLPRAAS